MSKERTESNFANPEESNFLDPEKVKQCAEKLAVMLLKLCQKRQQSSTFESSGLDQTDVDGAFKLVVEIFCEAKVTTCIDRKKVSDALLVEFQTQSEYCSMVVDVIFKEVPISSYGPFEMLEKNTNHRLRKIKQIIKTKFSSELNPPAPQWVTLTWSSICTHSVKLLFSFFSIPVQIHLGSYNQDMNASDKSYKTSKYNSEYPVVPHISFDNDTIALALV